MSAPGRRWVLVDRPWSLAAVLAGMLLLAGGCSPEHRMAHPEDPGGRYKIQIAAARRLLEQKVDWADRAEWEVIPQAGGWKLYAWRVEHPEERGPMRYVPWGYFLIELDLQERPVHYKFGG